MFFNTTTIEVIYCLTKREKEIYLLYTTKTGLNEGCYRGVLHEHTAMRRAIEKEHALRMRCKREEYVNRGNSTNGGVLRQFDAEIDGLAIGNGTDVLNVTHQLLLLDGHTH